MDEHDLQTFIDLTRRYFEKTTARRARVGRPYIQMDHPVMLDYSGFIRISGSSDGYVYITAPSPMLEELVRMEGLETVDAEDMKDMVGEIANTISSNARATFGQSFDVSVPRVVCGEGLEDIRLPHMTYVVPIRWSTHESFLVVGLTV